ncbi:MAG: HU family DNA-binding protein [Rickettsiales bacterium]|jgi:DNA-binding protein HU-beta|nr:HU family DNA-binding protein [Rickettsiales bacterium]
MYKNDIVKAVADKTGFTQKDTVLFVDNFLGVVRGSLLKGEKVTLIGFGTFDVVNTKEKMGRNPQTGKELKIPASKKVKFTVGKLLKEEIKAPCGKGCKSVAGKKSGKK